MDEQLALNQMIKKNELKTRRWIKTRIMDELSGILYELNKKLDKI